MNKEIKVKQIKNYTKHPVNVYVRGKIKTFLPEDKTLRCSYSNELIADMSDLLLPGGIKYENGNAKGCKSLVRLRKQF